MIILLVYYSYYVERSITVKDPDDSDIQLSINLKFSASDVL